MNLHLKFMFPGTIFTLIILIFCGPWSDKYGIVKPFLFVPFFGEIITMCGKYDDLMVLKLFKMDEWIHSARPFL